MGREITVLRTPTVPTVDYRAINLNMLYYTVQQLQRECCKRFDITSVHAEEKILSISPSSVNNHSLDILSVLITIYLTIHI